MYCSGCGEVLAGRAVCPRCGRVHAMPGGPLGGPAGYGMPAYAGMPVPLASVERRVNSLAVCWLVFAGLTALFGLMGLAFAHAFMAGHGGPWNHGFGPGFGHRYWEGPGMPLFFLRFAKVALLLKVGLAVAAGMGLLRKARWGRSVAIVAACFALFSFPLGTALGVWTLAVLLNGFNAAGYQAMVQD